MPVDSRPMIALAPFGFQLAFLDEPAEALLDRAARAVERGAASPTVKTPP